MLSKTALNIALSHVLDLTNRGFQLTAKSDSVVDSLTGLSLTQFNVVNANFPSDLRMLDDLTNPSLPNDNVKFRDLVCLDLITNISNYTSHKITYGENNEPIVSNTIHSETMEEVATTIGASLANQLNVYRNVIKPIIVDYVEKVTEAVNNTPVPNPISDFNIIEYDIPEPLKDAGLIQLVEKFVVKQSDIPNLTGLNCANLTEQEIIELLMTDDKSIDRLTLEWITSLNDVTEIDNTIYRVWSTFFKNGGADNESNGKDLIDFVNLQYFTPLRKINIYTLVFLLTHNLIEKDIVSTSESSTISLSNYRTVLTNLREFAATQIESCMGIATKLMDKLNTVLISSNHDKRTAYVYSPAYRTWIQGGGKNEIILGAVINNLSVLSASALDEKSDELLREWRTYVLVVRGDDEDRRYKNFLIQMDQQYLNLFANQTEIEQQYSESVPNFDLMSKQYYQTELATISKTALYNPHDLFVLCTKIICRSRFYYTEAERVLLSMNEIGLAHPEIECPLEIALLATTKYVCDFLRDQLSVTKV